MLNLHRIDFKFKFISPGTAAFIVDSLSFKKSEMHNFSYKPIINFFSLQSITVVPKLDFLVLFSVKLQTLTTWQTYGFKFCGNLAVKVYLLLLSNQGLHLASNGI